MGINWFDLLYLIQFFYVIASTLETSIDHKILFLNFASFLNNLKPCTTALKLFVVGSSEIYWVLQYSPQLKKKKKYLTVKIHLTLKSHLILNQTRLNYRKLSNMEIQYSKAILHNNTNKVSFNVLFSTHERNMAAY